MVILSHGHGMSLSHYTVLAQALASRGYLALTLAHPYGGFAVHPGGRVVTLGDDPEDTKSHAGKCNSRCRSAPPRTGDFAAR